MRTVPGEVAHMDGAAFEGGLPGITLPKGQTGVLEVISPQTTPGGVIEKVGMRVKDKNIGGIHTQLQGDLLNEDAEGKVEMEAGGDGRINGLQGFGVLKPLLGFCTEVGVGNGLRGVVAQPLTRVDCV